MTTKNTALTITAADKLAKSANRTLAAKPGQSKLAAFAQSARESVLLVDISSSMGCTLAGGERRIDATRRVVKSLRETNPVPVIVFGGHGNPAYVDGIPEPAGMTPLHKGIEFSHREGATHIVLVTDGCPDSESYAFRAAQEFGGVIDTFYIGDGQDEGAIFCAKLAALTGGTSNVTDLGNPKELAGKIALLLGDGGAATLLGDGQ